MIMMPDLMDHFGFGASKIPIHRGDVTTCPCIRCIKIRVVGRAMQALSEAFRLIAYLKWMHWRFTKERNERIVKEETNGV